MTEKEQLQSLVERLPEGEIHTARRFLEYLIQETVDPVAQALRYAPEDDEPLTAEDLAALEEAEQDLRGGRVISHEQARRQLLG